MIPQRNISILSNRLAREGGRRIPEAVLERDYCLAWFLVGFSRSLLRKRLVFKGGTALKRCYFGDYRFSEDLDFTLVEEAPLEMILAELEGVYAEVRQSSGVIIRYSREDRAKHQNSHTFYLAYEGPLPGTYTKEVKVDITISERIVMPVQERPVLKGYDEYSDLPEDSNILVYALEEILVEKVVALTDRARNEPRDLYDVWYLTAKENLDLSALTKEITSKLEFRGRALAGTGDEFVNKETRLKKLWQARLANQMAALPHFDEVYRSVRRSLRMAGLMNV
ncbi:MAG: nucleotidyl transferase AbiEii/AbiGii toxin family protein [Deltaproteobacteria bacterium]|nr:nucleotidyl transferase AbiEii/AbiGii toxin family protein [Deltaproteobacteria bacterium]